MNGSSVSEYSYKVKDVINRFVTLYRETIVIYNLFSMSEVVNCNL